MPKNASIELFERWREMDLRLTRGELHPRLFWEKWRVTEKTFRRDLAMFEKSLGKKIKREVARERTFGPCYRYSYEDGELPLFTASSDKGAVVEPIDWGTPPLPSAPKITPGKKPTKAQKQALLKSSRPGAAVDGSLRGQKKPPDWKPSARMLNAEQMGEWNKRRL